jgi:IS6 family transposase
MVRQTHEKGAAVGESAAARRLATAGGPFIDAARASRHIVGDRWFVDETYIKVAGRWIYLYRAVDQSGQVIDVLVWTRRDAAAARSFFARALRVGCVQVEVTTDRAPVYPRVLDELQPAPRQVTERYANNGVEADHGRLKARLRTNVRTQTIGLGAHDRSRARVRAEPPARPLRDHQRPRLA